MGIIIFDKIKVITITTNGMATKTVLIGAISHVPIIKIYDLSSITNSGGFALKNSIIRTAPISPAIECTIQENQLIP